MPIHGAGVPAMIAFLKRLWGDRRGNALLITAASLPLVLGSAGLASDTIQWALWKRQLQRAADSAAMAGVHAKIQDASYSDAVTQDLAHNSHVGINTTTTSISPPASGSYASDPYAVRVSLSVQKALSFSSIFMSNPPTIRAAATATIVPSGEYCVVSLIDTTSTGITATGSATLNLGCGMITNSTSMSAAVATGSASVTATPIAAVGGIPASNNWGEGTTLQPFTAEQDDPFADVAPPSSFPSGQCPQLRVLVNETVDLSSQTGEVCYRSMTLNGNVTLGAATYVIDGGSLSIGAQATVRCNGCTIVLTSRTADTNPSSIGNAIINGGAEVDLVAPETGTYAGLIIYQDRRAQSTSNANTTNHLNGNSNSSFHGAFYFPRQETLFNGTAGMVTDCLQLVAYTVTFSGNMDLTNSCASGGAAQPFEGKQVRLVE